MVTMKLQLALEHMVPSACPVLQQTVTFAVDVEHQMWGAPNWQPRAALCTSSHVDEALTLTAELVVHCTDVFHLPCWIAPRPTQRVTPRVPGSYPDLSTLLVSEFHKDVVFHCADGDQVSAHSALLRLRSVRLAQALDESKEHIVISLPQYQRRTVNALLKFLYVGKLVWFTKHAEAEDVASCREGGRSRFFFVYLTFGHTHCCSARLVLFGLPL